MSNRLQKKNSMPSTVTAESPQGKSKKNKTLTRMFHKNIQSFNETSLKSEMKHRPSYQSDPNLLADQEEFKVSKKTRSWKWPFPKHKNAHELPDQIKGVLYKKSYFPE